MQKYGINIRHLEIIVKVIEIYHKSDKKVEEIQLRLVSSELNALDTTSDP